jgi:hypothetical protein
VRRYDPGPGGIRATGPGDDRGETDMSLRAPLLRIMLPSLLLLGASVAQAEWQDLFGPPVFLSAAAGDQTAPACVSDGAGGVIAVWQDTRSTAES